MATFHYEIFISSFAELVLKALNKICYRSELKDANFTFFTLKDMINDIRQKMATPAHRKKNKYAAFECFHA